MLNIILYSTTVILPTYSAEKRAAGAARKKFILDPFSDHLVFVQVFRVCLFLIIKLNSLKIILYCERSTGLTQHTAFTFTCDLAWIFLHMVWCENVDTPFLQRIFWFAPPPPTPPLPPLQKFQLSFIPFF